MGNKVISTTWQDIPNANRYQYEFRVKYEGKLRPGDYYAVGENGEKTLVFPDDVVSMLKSGKNVFISVGNGKCRELSLGSAE